MQITHTRQSVIIDTVWPRAGIVRELALILGGSLLIALAAQIRITLPFTPVPITGQTFAVLLVAALYGSRTGSLTVATYVALGALGLPVLAGGSAGLTQLLGPTGGYLAGFIAAAYVVGLLSERGWDRKPWTTAASMIVGNVVIYVCGVVWLSRFVGWEAVLVSGVLPFLVGDALKIALATILLPAGWRLIARAGQQ